MTETPWRAFSLLAGLCLAVSAQAHRMPLGMTTVVYNAATGYTEIVHRLHRHDAEEAMRQVTSDPAADLLALPVRAHLALYTEQRFSIAQVEDGKPGQPLSLELVGAQIDGDYVLVYQEFKGRLPGQVAVRDEVLRELDPRQINRVNVTTEQGMVKSLVFKADDGWKLLSLNGPEA